MDAIRYAFNQYVKEENPRPTSELRSPEFTNNIYEGRSRFQRDY
jgi:hypothetical protein